MCCNLFQIFSVTVLTTKLFPTLVLLCHGLLSKTTVLSIRYMKYVGFNVIIQFFCTVVKLTSNSSQSVESALDMFRENFTAFDLFVLDKSILATLAVVQIDDRKVSYKEVALLLRGCGIDLDHNRFLILQVV